MKKIDRIKNLPVEFDLQKKINTSNIIYHARKRKHDYLVTWDDHQTTFSIKEFHRKIFEGNFVPITDI